MLVANFKIPLYLSPDATFGSQLNRESATRSGNLISKQKRDDIKEWISDRLKNVIAAVFPLASETAVRRSAKISQRRAISCGEFCSCGKFRSVGVSVKLFQSRFGCACLTCRCSNRAWIHRYLRLSLSVSRSRLSTRLNDWHTLLSAGLGDRISISVSRRLLSAGLSDRISISIG